MIRNLFEGPGWIIVLVIVLLLFGATRLPALARSLGQSTKILRNELKEGKKDETPLDSPNLTTARGESPEAPRESLKGVDPANSDSKT